MDWITINRDRKIILYFSSEKKHLETEERKRDAHNEKRGPFFLTCPGWVNHLRGESFYTIIKTRRPCRKKKKRANVGRKTKDRIF